MSATRGRQTGFVYVARTQGAPGLLKVGFTTRRVEERLRELAGAGTPYPFELVAAYRVEEPHEVEKAAHSRLACFRFNKEWFRCTPLDAMRLVTEAAQGRLLGACTAEDLSLAYASVAKWEQAGDQHRKRLEQLRVEQARTAAKIRAELESQAWDEREALLTAFGWPIAVKYMLLAPAVLAGAIACLASDNPVLVVSVAAAGAALWSFLTSVNRETNESGPGYRQLMAAVNKSVEAETKVATADMAHKASRLSQRLELTKRELQRAHAVLVSVRSASNSDDVPARIVIECGVCESSFEAFRAPHHVCPSCGALLG